MDAPTELRTISVPHLYPVELSTDNPLAINTEGGKECATQDQPEPFPPLTSSTDVVDPSSAGNGGSTSRRLPYSKRPLEELQAYLSAQCVASNCPCKGDRSRHDLAIAESDLDWEIHRSTYARRAREDAMDEVMIAMRRLQDADERWEKAKRNVEEASYQVQQILDRQPIPLFPQTEAAGG